MQSLVLSPPAPAAARASQRARRGGEKIRARGRRLASYTDTSGAPHEICAWAGADGSVLVVDLTAELPAAPRLLAHLSADEPPENALIVCADYLERAPLGCGRCRELSALDVCSAPALEESPQAPAPAALVRVPEQRSGAGDLLMLAIQHISGALPQLRWRLSCGPRPLDAPPCDPHQTRPVSLREAIAALEDYEPLRAMTRRAIARVRPGERLSTTMLRAELARVERSPIILNRGIREAVLASVARGELSMSEIAIRCGRVKRDSRGNESGETSWLARRLGLLPEGGQLEPTPWMHSAVLALIARRGLGIAPREVEL